MKRHTLISIGLIWCFACLGLRASAADYLLQIESTTQGSVAVFRMNGVEVKSNGSVSSGEKLRVVATVTDAEHYRFDRFIVENGTEVLLTEGSDTEGTFTVSGTGKVKVGAFFAGKPQALTLVEPDKSKGNYTVSWNGVTLADKAEVPYGSNITIHARPEEGFVAGSYLINGTSRKDSVVAITEETQIEVKFDTRMCTIEYDFFNPLLLQYGSETVAPGDKVPYNAEVIIANFMGNDANYYYLMINDTLVNMHKMSLLYTVKDDVKIKTYSGPKKSISVHSNAQTVVYDGKPHPYTEYISSPMNLPGWKFTYALSPSTKYGKEEPVDAGVYSIKMVREADSIFTKSSRTFTKKLTIEPAPIDLVEQPKVTFSDGSYNVTGGEYRWGNTPVEGSYQVNPVGTGKLAEVVFTPDSKNFKSFTCQLPVEGKDVPSYSVKMDHLPQGVSLHINNGDLTVFNGNRAANKVAEETSLTVKAVALPEGKVIDYFTCHTDGGQAEKITFPYSLDKDLNLSVVLANTAITSKKTITPKEEGLDQILDYNESGIVLFESKLLADSPISESSWIITYKESGTPCLYPDHAGSYEVEFFRPEDDTYYACRGTAKLTVRPIKPMVEEVKASAVYPGQTLASSKLSGRVNVAGQFVWKDPSQKVKEGLKYEVNFIPADPNYMSLIGVKSLPVSILSDNSQLAISAYAEHGNIYIKNTRTGMELKDGDLISFGDQLTISAYPVVGYELKNLTVNGQTIRSGSQYTVGQVAPAILAEFVVSTTKPEPPYRTFSVTIPSVVGTIVNLAGTHEVEEGKSFSFDVEYDPLYGAPQVTAGGKALANDGGFTYTIGKVTQDTTIAILLEDYGVYEVEIPRDSLLGTIKIERLEGQTKGASDTYTFGEKLKLTAVPVPGTWFRSWWDHNEDNPREYCVKNNVFLEAKFGGVPTSNETINKAVKIKTEGRTVHIYSDRTCTARLITMQGVVASQTEINGNGFLSPVAGGIYIVTLSYGDRIFAREKVILP